MLRGSRRARTERQHTIQSHLSPPLHRADRKDERSQPNFTCRATIRIDSPNFTCRHPIPAPRLSQIFFLGRSNILSNRLSSTPNSFPLPAAIPFQFSNFPLICLLGDWERRRQWRSRWWQTSVRSAPPRRRCCATWCPRWPTRCAPGWRRRVGAGSRCCSPTLTSSPPG